MPVRDEPIASIQRGVLEIIQHEELKDKLRAGKKLTVKAGYDPTVSDLHLGHTVLINKMRTFQDLGHRVVFLVGDFTATIGDPSGRNATRPQLTPEQAKANAKTYAEQVFKILDPEKTEIVFNSSWMSDKTASDLIQLASKYTVARMLERDDFHKRYHGGRSIAIHEFLYPLIQGYDSVELDADIELGGSDQRFNLIVGRELQRHYGQAPQVVITMPLLEGTDGVDKMSKSKDNYIGITEPPSEIFGKIMSLSDELMWRYFELLSFYSERQIAEWRRQSNNGEINPRDIKLLLAKELVGRYYNETTARDEEQKFVARYRHGAVEETAPSVEIKVSKEGLQIGYLLKQCGLAGSTSEAIRLVKQGAVRIDRERVTDTHFSLLPGQNVLVEAGKKRAAKVALVEEN